MNLKELLRKGPPRNVRPDTRPKAEVVPYPKGTELTLAKQERTPAKALVTSNEFQKERMRQARALREEMAEDMKRIERETPRWGGDPRFDRSPRSDYHPYEGMEEWD